MPITLVRSAITNFPFAYSKTIKLSMNGTKKPRTLSQHQKFKTLALARHLRDKAMHAIGFTECPASKNETSANRSLYLQSEDQKKTSAKYAKNADRIVHATYLKNAQAIYTKPRRIDRVGFTPTILSK